jgi:hypothetical protein
MHIYCCKLLSMGGILNEAVNWKIALEPEIKKLLYFS